MLDSWSRPVESAPNQRAMLEDFLLWVYTPRAHADGFVATVIDEALAFPYPQSSEAFRGQLDAFRAHDTFDRLPQIAVPTLVVAGGVDIATSTRYGRVVAERIPGALFDVLPDEAHQPFQERPTEFNALVDAFWAKVDSRA